MSEHHKAVARTVFDIWNDGTVERLDGLIAPDVVHHDPFDPNGSRGLPGMKQTIASVRARLPNLQLTVEDQIAQDDQVATRWTGWLAPETAVVGITIDRFENGKIVEAWRTIVTVNPTPRHADDRSAWDAPVATSPAAREPPDRTPSLDPPIGFV